MTLVGLTRDLSSGEIIEMLRALQEDKYLSFPLIIVDHGGPEHSVVCRTRRELRDYNEGWVDGDLVLS